MTATPPKTFVVAALALLLVPAAAFATRTPTKQEKAAIVRGIERSSAFRGVPKSEYSVYRVRISTEGPYAKTYIKGRPGSQPAYMVLRKRGGRWRQKTFGTSSLGCGLPVVVAEDLKVECYRD